MKRLTVAGSRFSRLILGGPRLPRQLDSASRREPKRHPQPSAAVARLLAFVAALPTLNTAGCNTPCAFSAMDEAGVRDAIGRYVDAWLANDPDAVMATLSEDIVLQPHHGVAPVVGAASVREFWFPQGPPTIVTAFTVDTRDVSGCGSLAYAWGRSAVEWTYEGEMYSQEGNTLTVLNRGNNGAWRIVHQIWNDPPPVAR